MSEHAAVLEYHDIAPHDGAVVLQAVDIAKTYGVTRALKGVNFEVRRGKVTVLFGENGAGKSTLMKILSGVEKPTAGQLILDGEPINLESTNDAVERGISIIHQELTWLRTSAFGTTSSSAAKFGLVPAPSITAENARLPSR